jgi:glycosyltransferase involved in cell wall biosynthesis
MDILFLHPNMPGQYKHLARSLGAEGKHRIRFITKHKDMEIPGVTRVRYRVPRNPSPHTHRYLVGTERAVLQGQEVWRHCKKLRDEEGFSPRIILAHPGWGDALFVKDVFPQAKLLCFFEFYYRPSGADMGFDPDDAMRPDDFARARVKNTNNILSLEAADWGICPTVWQWSTHPQEFRHKLSVLHDGVDANFCKPNPDAVFTVPGTDITFKPGDEVVTHIERNFEPYRGFPTFMQAAEIILRERPKAHIVVVGADGVSYGKAAPKGTTYRKLWSERVKLDPKRIHFVGSLPFAEVISMLQVSAAHMYLTYPFVLSWSLMEAMACGCAIVSSRTKPVTEVMREGENGLLADFYSPQEVAQKTIQLLKAKDRNAELRANARATILGRYDYDTVLPLHRRLVGELAEGALPPPAHETMRQIINPEDFRTSWWTP